MMGNYRSSAIKSVVTSGLSLLLLCVVSGGSIAWGQEPAVASTVPQKEIPPEIRGDLLMIRKEYQAAIAVYDSSPEQSAEIFNKIGLAYHHLYAIDRAKSSYESALRLRPDYPEALNNLGAVFYAERDYRKASRFYRKAIKLTPHDAIVRRNLAATYLAQGKQQEAMKAYRAAFLADPSTFGDDAQNVIPEPATVKERAAQNYCLASLYAQQGMNDRAIEYLRKAIDAGFNGYKRLMEDPDFATLRKTAEFNELMTQERKR